MAKLSTYTAASALTGTEEYYGEQPTGTARMITSLQQAQFGESRAKQAIRCRPSGNQTIANNFWDTIDFDTESFDYGTHHDTSTNNSRITPAVQGVWCFIAGIEWTANATGVRAVRLFLNGTSTIAGNTAENAGGSLVTRVSTSTLYEMNGSTDYMEVQGLQLSGGNLDTVGNLRTFFAAYLVCRT